MKRSQASRGSCLVTHTPWKESTPTSVNLKTDLWIGRDPNKPKFQIGPEDQFISANAVHLTLRETGVEVQNTSSHSQVEVHHTSGVRILFPRESLTVVTSSKLLIPSRDINYSIQLELSGFTDQTTVSTQTKRLVPEDLRLADERIPALAGLCASFLFPQHFGTAPLNASQIAELLSAKGYVITPKAVNHKIQRTREQVEEHTGSYLDNRQGLAQFLIRHRYITSDDVRKHLM